MCPDLSAACRQRGPYMSPAGHPDKMTEGMPERHLPIDRR